jgi:hypothetical protein
MRRWYAGNYSLTPMTAITDTRSTSLALIPLISKGFHLGLRNRLEYPKASVARLTIT